MLNRFISIFVLIFSIILSLGIGASPAEAQVVLFQESFRNTTVDNAGVWSYGVTDRLTPAPLPPPPPNPPRIFSEPPCLTARNTIPSYPLPDNNNPPLNTPGGRQGTGSPPGCPEDSKGSTNEGDGNGVLRLTTASTDIGGVNNDIDKRRQGSFILYNPTINSTNGLNIEFDFFAYNGTRANGTGADGISFFILDGNVAAPTTAGAVGGSLGYAQQIVDDLPGIAGGYIGVGFDEFGQFSNENRFGSADLERFGSTPDTGPDGANPQRIPQSIAVRGATTGNIATSNPYLVGSVSPIPISNAATADRNSARRRARVILTPTGLLTIQISNDGINFQTVINSFNIAATQGVPPANIRFGFAASTGGETNIHEVRDLVITTIPPNLSLEKIASQAAVVAGQQYTYTLRVSNDPLAGSTTGPVEITDSLPVGLTINSAAGTNWNCTITGQNIACTYTGGVLSSGAVAPDLIVAVTPTAGVQETPITNTATVTTPGDSDLTNNTATANVIFTAPRLSAQKDVADLGDPAPPTSVNTVAEAGELLRYTITISNTGNAPSTNTQLTDPIPANTVYVLGSTRLNADGVPDVGDAMPFENGGLVNSAGELAGTIAAGAQAVVVYEVRVVDPLPGNVNRIENQAQVTNAELPPLPPLDTNLAVLPTQAGPNISLIKRIFRVVRNGVTFNFLSPEGTPPDPAFVGTINPPLQVSAGDQVTYRIYALSDGSVTANNVRICDQIPTGSAYAPNTIGLSGITNVGTAIGPPVAQTDAPGGDAQFVAAPNLVASPPCTNPNNPNGSVLVEPFDLPRNQRRFLEFTTQIP